MSTAAAAGHVPESDRAVGRLVDCWGLVTGSLHRHCRCRMAHLVSHGAETALQKTLNALVDSVLPGSLAALGLLAH